MDSIIKDALEKDIIMFYRSSGMINQTAGYKIFVKYKGVFLELKVSINYSLQLKILKYAEIEYDYFIEEIGDKTDNNKAISHKRTINGYFINEFREINDITISLFVEIKKIVREYKLKKVLNG